MGKIMKLLKNCLGTLLVLMIGVITFFTWNLIGSFVSNYQSLSPTALSGLPMIIFMIEIYVVLFGIFNYIVLERRDAFFFNASNAPLFIIIAPDKLVAYAIQRRFSLRLVLGKNIVPICSSENILFTIFGTLPFAIIA